MELFYNSNNESDAINAINSVWDKSANTKVADGKSVPTQTS